MPTPTFYTPDRSQIELSICPRKSFPWWGVMGILAFISVGVIASGWVICTVNGVFSLRTIIWFVINAIMLLLVFGLLVTDDQVTLDREGLTYRRKDFFTKVRFFELSSIEGVELVQIGKGEDRREVILIRLKNGSSVKIANTSIVPQKSRQIFVAECTEFLERWRS